MTLVPSPPRRAVADDCHVRRSHCLATDAATQASSVVSDASTMTTSDAVASAVVGTKSDPLKRLSQQIMARLRCAIEDAMQATQGLRARITPSVVGNGEFSHSSGANSDATTASLLYASSRSTMAMPCDASCDSDPATTTTTLGGGAALLRAEEEGYPLGANAGAGQSLYEETSATIAALHVADATAAVAAALSIANALLDELQHSGAQVVEGGTLTVAHQASSILITRQTSPRCGSEASFVSLVPVTSELGSANAPIWHPVSLQENSAGGDEDGSPALSRTPSVVPHRTTTVLARGEDETGHKVINDYVILDDLGKGACGSVKLAFNVTRNVSVAVKVVRRGRSGALGVSRTAGLKEEALRREIALMKRLSHPNIVQLYEVIDDPTAMKLYLIMQYADEGAVGAVRADRTCTTLPLFDVVDVAYQCASGLKYLHNLDIVHRDIKPENLFRTSEGRVMIGDFGISGLVEDAADMPAGVGTPLFMAPELHAAAEGARTGAEEGPHRQGSPSAPSVGTAAADMWALGVTLFALTSGRLPFPSTAAIQDPVAVAAFPAMHCDCACAPDTPCSALLVAWRTCVEAMLARDPAHRPSANALRKVSKALRNAPCEICCVCAPSSSPATASDDVTASMPTTELQLPQCDPKEMESSVASGSLVTPRRGGGFSGSRASNVVFATSRCGSALTMHGRPHRSPRVNGRITASAVSDQECHDAITSLVCADQTNTRTRSLELSMISSVLHSQMHPPHEPPSQAAHPRR